MLFESTDTEQVARYNCQVFNCIAMLVEVLAKISRFETSQGCYFFLVNSLSANPTEFPNTLKQLVGNSRQTVSLCLVILWGWHLKG